MMGKERDVFGSDSFTKEDNEWFEKSFKEMSGTMNKVAPELAKSSVSMASSMMTEMLKKFWWIPVFGFAILGLIIWGIVAIVT